MKPRYAVINEFEKEKFEKEWQMPYGYGNALFITMDPKKAIDYLNDKVFYSGDASELVVEKISDEGRELYYRI